MPSSSSRGKTCALDRKSTRLNSSHCSISYAVFCLKKKKTLLTYSHARLSRAVSWPYNIHAPRCVIGHVLILSTTDRIVGGLQFFFFFFFFKDPAPTDISPLPPHAPLPL